MERSNINLGRMLREARDKCQLTQHELAKKIGKKQSYISIVEKYSANNMKIQTLLDMVENGFDGKVKIEIVLKNKV